MAREDRFPRALSLAAVVACDALGIVSADYDARHLAALCGALGFARTALLVQDPRPDEWPDGTHVYPIDACGPAFRRAFTQVLEDLAAAAAPDAPCDLFVAVCADAAVGLGSSQFVAGELTRLFGERARIFVLADMCASGSYLALPWRSVDDANFQSHASVVCGPPALLCVAAVDDGQADADDVSALGFDGGLTAAFVDYVLAQAAPAARARLDACEAPQAKLACLRTLSLDVAVCPRAFFTAHVAAQRAACTGVSSVLSALHVGDLVAF